MMIEKGKETRPRREIHVEGLRSARFHAHVVSFPASLDHFPEVWARLESYLKQLGLGEDERWQWYLCLLELVNNAIVHGSNNDASCEVSVRWAVVKDEIELSVSDQGNGPSRKYTNSPRLPEDITEKRGRGLYLVHNFSDSWEHWRSDRGYRCLIRKRVPDLSLRSLKLAEPFESVGRSVSSLSAFYQLGAAILHQEEPGAFLEKGLEHLVTCFHVKPESVSVVLSDRLDHDIREAFKGHDNIRGMAEVESSVAQVIRGGQGMDWSEGCCHPIVANEMNLGCLLVEMASGVSLSMAESAQTRVFADLFGVAIDHFRLRKEKDRGERFRREAEFANRIQRELLQAPALEPSNLGHVVHRSSSHGTVAGDYQEACYDRDGNLVLAIIDVMGKGASAAIFALMFRTSLHARLQSGLDLVDFLTSFNKTLYEWVGDGTRFITCTVAKIGVAGDEVEIINAGHCPSLVINGGRLVDQWLASGPPLGVFADADYETRKVGIDDLDALLLVSDGVYEWFDGGEVWGWDRFIDYARESLSWGPKLFWDRLQTRINESVEDTVSLDDQTLLWWTKSELGSAS